MHHPLSAEHREPSRFEAALFFLKTRCLIARRWWREKDQTVPRHPQRQLDQDLPIAGTAKAPLWTQISAAEFPLTAGKVQNLRAACAKLHGVEVPAGELFSFWKQLGRTSKSAGFTEGRELRSGCLVPSMGGGLCQLSGLLHAAALDAGLQVIERHTHSRTLPGAALEPERDATIYWNYVDLRFRADFPWRLEATLTATDLVVSIRALLDSDRKKSTSSLPEIGRPVRAAADGDCLTCGVLSCFRHPSANEKHAAAEGHSAFLLDGMWPEYNSWCNKHSHPKDHWLMPLDGHRWKKQNYAWMPPEETLPHYATWQTLWRSWQQRRLPAQGAVRQRFLLAAQRDLAIHYGKMLDPQARHLIISQTLLPHLWQAGLLGGRTFDVLMQRWPMAELHSRLDEAAAQHLQSETLADFRAQPELVFAELQALAAAARIITPHRAIAKAFGSRSILLDWQTPHLEAQKISTSGPTSPRWFFPASALGRKGIYELAAALRGEKGELLVLGKARENGADPLAGISHRAAHISELNTCTALIIPAWVEHEPRLALKALALGIPVIASRACGLSKHPLLREIDAGDIPALKAAMAEFT